MKTNLNKIFYKSSTNMSEICANSVDLIITSPPYFNIKDYSKNGYQNLKHSRQNSQDFGAFDDYKTYINAL